MINGKNDRLYDKRVVQRNIQNKLITVADYKNYLKQLKDEVSDSEKIALSEDDSEGSSNSKSE